MLKSFSTQLAATAFFGPVGLAYTSMATAVLYTLVLAVLYFTGFGVLAILVIWPLSVVTGMLYVKLHNDRIRQSGNRLLLGPDDESGLVSALGSWARGVAVLAVILGAGYLAYLYLPADGGVTAPGRIVNGTAAIDSGAGNTAATGTDNKIARTQSAAEAEAASVSNKPVIILPSRDIPKVIIDSSGKVSTTIAGESGNSGNGAANGTVARSALYVDRETVNLRQGPGTEYAVVTQLDRGEQLYEFARDGVWVNVETRTGTYAGWIHGNLLRR